MSLLKCFFCWSKVLKLLLNRHGFCQGPVLGTLRDLGFLCSFCCPSVGYLGMTDILFLKPTLKNVYIIFRYVKLINLSTYGLLGISIEFVLGPYLVKGFRLKPAEDIRREFNPNLNWILALGKGLWLLYWGGKFVFWNSNGIFI